MIRRNTRRFSTILPGYLTTREAAAVVGLSHSQFWRYVDQGLVPSRETSFGYAIRESDLKGFQRLPMGPPRKGQDKRARARLKK